MFNDRLDEIITMAKLIGWKVDKDYLDDDIDSKIIINLKKDEILIKIWIRLKHRVLNSFEIIYWSWKNFEDTERIATGCDVEKIEETFKKLVGWL